MRVNDIPPELFTIILRYCIEPTFSTVDKWKTIVPILAVCKKWRILALPLAYSRILIHCATRPEESELRTDFDENTIKDNADDLDKPSALITELRTNLSLLLYTHRQAPKKAFFLVTYYRNLLVDLRAVLIVLQANTFALQNIVDMTIIIQQSQNGTFDHFEDIDKNIFNMQSLASKIAHCVPSVKRLALDSNYYEPVFIEFSKVMVRSYAPQLCKLLAIPSSINADCEFSNKLIDLTLKQTGGWNNRMVIPTKSLKRLVLNGIDDVSLSWSIFKYTKRLACVDFENLEHLHISALYGLARQDDNDEVEAYTPPINKFNSSIYAPNIKTMYLEVCPSICSFILALPTGHTFRKIELSVFNDMSLFLENLTLSSLAMAVFAKYADYGRRMIDGIDFVNNLLRIPNFIESLGVSYIREYFDIEDFEQENLSKLASITIYNAPLSISKLLKLISNMPNLLELQIKNVVCLDLIGKNAEEQVGLLINLLQKMDPIQSNIRKLELAFADDDIPLQLKKKIICCLSQAIQLSDEAQRILTLNEN